MYNNTTFMHIIQAFFQFFYKLIYIIQSFMQKYAK